MAITKMIRTCPFCGKKTSLDVDSFSLRDYRRGMLVQEAFPFLSASERELIKTGMCLDCQEEVFGSEEDEDEEDFLCDEFSEDECEEGFDPYCGCYTGDC